MKTEDIKDAIGGLLAVIEEQGESQIIASSGDPGAVKDCLRTAREVLQGLPASPSSPTVSLTPEVPLIEHITERTTETEIRAMLKLEKGETYLGFLFHRLLASMERAKDLPEKSIYRKANEQWEQYELRNIINVFIYRKANGYITEHCPVLQCNCEATVSSPFSGIPLTIPTHTADCPVHGQYAAAPVLSEQAIDELERTVLDKAVIDIDAYIIWKDKYIAALTAQQKQHTDKSDI